MLSRLAPMIGAGGFAKGITPAAKTGDYLSEEYDVQVGFERNYLGPSDKLYMGRKEFQDGYKRGYQQGYQYTDAKKTQHLEDTARCEPGYMYLGWRRGYTY